MRYTILLFSAAVLMVVHVARGQDPRASRTPARLVLDRERVDLGVMHAGDIKKVSIRLRNGGEDTLHIMDVSTSCGCTAVKKLKPFLLKGESDVLEVEFNSSNFKGTVTKRVFIKTNDSKQGTATLTLTGKILNEIEIVSPRLPIPLGSIAFGKPVTISLTLKNTGKSAVSITGIEDREGRLKLVQQPVKLPPQGSGEVVITLVPKKEGFVNEMIYLITDSKRNTRVPFRVFYTATAAS
jgi:hypothetical protein